MSVIALHAARRYHPDMPRKPVDPASLPPWKRNAPPGKSRRLSAQQVQAARVRAAQAGRRYPNLVDNMWAARNVARGEASTSLGEDEWAWRPVRESGESACNPAPRNCIASG